MTNLKQIENFLSNKHIGVIGASRNPKSFSSALINELINANYSVYPVNPKAETINDLKAFHTVEDLPKEVTAILYVTNAKATDALLQEAIDKGFKNIWIQNASETDKTESIINNNNININLITKQCIIMYLNNTGMHRIHKFVLNIFGKLPK